MSIVLVFTHKNGEQCELPMVQRNVVVGRSSKADLMLPDAKISSKHCRFSLNRQGQVEFQDLDSTNGSFLNNAKITGHILKIGESIVIGDTKIEIDERRLSAPERLAIGRVETPYSQDGGLSVPASFQLGAKVGDNEPKKSAVKIPSKGNNVIMTGNDKVIEQEPSTGDTRHLEIDSRNKKKK